MIDLGFAVLVAFCAAGAGKRILDRIGQSPAHPLDALALALPLGLGLISLAALVLGELGCLNRIGLAIELAIVFELGVVGWFRLARQWRAMRASRQFTEPLRPFDLAIAITTALVLCATLISATAPVTDGDALCYHLQVPKVFLMRGSVGFLPDLHETIYPLVTEMLYAVALEFRGPVACRGIQWVLGVAFALSVTALARPSLGRRAWWAGAIALLVPAVSNGMSAPLNDVSLAAFGTAAIFAWTRLHERPSDSAALVAGVIAGLALGVKYPALVLFALLAGGIALRALLLPPKSLSITTAALALAGERLCRGGRRGGRLVVSPRLRSTPAIRSFRSSGTSSAAGLDEVLDPIKRPLAVTPWNLLLALGPLSLEPDRFDSFSHQFGPVVPAVPAGICCSSARRVGCSMLAALGLCLSHDLPDAAPEHAVPAGRARADVGRRGLPGEHAGAIARRCPRGCSWACFVAVLGFEASVAVARARHALPVLLGRESTADFLARREPTFQVGRWAARYLPKSAHLDRPGPSRLLHSARLHDGAGPSPPNRPGPAR